MVEQESRLSESCQSELEADPLLSAYHHTSIFPYRSPGHPEAHQTLVRIAATLGRNAFSAGRLEEAATQFEAALFCGGEPRVCREYLARIHNLRRDWPKALEQWRWLHSHDERQPEPLLQIGRALFRLGQFGEASEAFRAFLDRSPGHPEAHQTLVRIAATLGRNAFNAGRLEEAATQFETALSCGGEPRICREYLARIHNLRRDWPKALEQWRWLHSHDERQPEPLLQIGRALFRLGQFGEASEAFRAFLDRSPGHPEAHQTLARIAATLGQNAFNAGRLEEAATQFETALSRGGEPRVCREYLARIHNLRRDWPKALEQWRWLHSHDERQPEPLLQIGRALFRLGQFGEASEAFRAFLDRSPGHPEAHQTLARIEGLLIRRLLGRAQAALAEGKFRKARLAIEAAFTGPGDDGHAWLALAEVSAELGDTDFTAAAIRHIANMGKPDARVAVNAARLAQRSGISRDARSLYRLALASRPSDGLAIEVARFYSAARLNDDAIDAWTSLIGVARATVEAINHVTRILLLQGRLATVIPFFQAHALDVLGGLARRPPNEQNAAVLIFNRYVDSANRLSNSAAVDWLITLLGESEPDSAICCCLRARLFDSLGRKDAAERELNKALSAEAGIPAGVEINVRAELSAHFIRYGLYQDAYKDYRAVRADVAKLANPYHYRFRTFVAVQSRRPTADARFYPECLLEEVLNAAAARPVAYRPVSGRVMMVSGSLGQGGGEKQTVTVAHSFARRGAARRLYLAVRSLDLRPSDDFFVPLINSSGINWGAYGTDWFKVSKLPDSLPELSGQKQLSVAIDLLPHNLREEIIRVSRLILEERPLTVHIWQDMPAVAVACLLCGVPRYFIHRGSLSPEYWTYNEYQWHTHFRPMQFIYRFLARRPEFFFLNNSKIGCQTDANWIGVAKDDRFRVLYNAVQFESLGEPLGRNTLLRREIAIPDGAPVVGGSFRLVPVKRPLLWMETARLVLEAVPDAHFVIIGGGEMTKEILEYASQHGFASRLHLPGRVADVGAWYRVMDVKLLTSEREGIPNAIIEAQHFGVPVVATDVGGISEALDPGKTGYSVKDATAENFAAHVIAVLADRAWRDRARRAAPKFVHDQFSLDKVLAQLEEYYDWREPAAARAPNRSLRSPNARDDRAPSRQRQPIGPDRLITFRPRSLGACGADHPPAESPLLP